MELSEDKDRRISELEKKIAELEGKDADTGYRMKSRVEAISDRLAEELKSLEDMADAPLQGSGKKMMFGGRYNDEGYSSFDMSYDAGSREVFFDISKTDRDGKTVEKHTVSCGVRDLFVGDLDDKAVGVKTYIRDGKSEPATEKTSFNIWDMENESLPYMDKSFIPSIGFRFGQLAKGCVDELTVSCGYTFTKDERERCIFAFENMLSRGARLSPEDVLSDKAKLMEFVDIWDKEPQLSKEQKEAVSQLRFPDSCIEEILSTHLYYNLTGRDNVEERRLSIDKIIKGHQQNDRAIECINAQKEFFGSLSPEERKNSGIATVISDKIMETVMLGGSVKTDRLYYDIGVELAVGGVGGDILANRGGGIASCSEKTQATLRLVDRMLEKMCGPDCAGYSSRNFGRLADTVEMCEGFRKEIVKEGIIAARMGVPCNEKTAMHAVREIPEACGDFKNLLMVEFVKSYKFEKIQISERRAAFGKHAPEKSQGAEM